MRREDKQDATEFAACIFIVAAEIALIQFFCWLFEI